MNKKGQEEIMGFMLVIIVVVVIGIGLLVIMKPEVSEKKDFQVENLLYSLTETTYEGQDISSRIRDCENGYGCVELGEGINVLLETVFSKSGITIGKNIKGYEMIMSGEGGVEYNLLEGEITGQSRGSATVIGNTMIRIKFYY